MSTSIFFPVQPMIFDPPSNPEESPGLPFPCYTHGITRGLVLSQHGLYGGYFLPFLTVLVYKTTASGLAKASFMLKHGRYLCIIYLLYY